VTPKPYSFKPSLELLRELKSLTAAQKLQWLEDANHFISVFLKPEDLARWKKALNEDK